VCLVCRLQGTKRPFTLSKPENGEGSILVDWERRGLRSTQRFHKNCLNNLQFCISDVDVFLFFLSSPLS